MQKKTRLVFYVLATQLHIFTYLENAQTFFCQKLCHKYKCIYSQNSIEGYYESVEPDLVTCSIDSYQTGNHDHIIRSFLPISLLLFLTIFCIYISTCPCKLLCFTVINISIQEIRKKAKLYF